MLIRKSADIQPSEITDRSLYGHRRRFTRGLAAVALSAGISRPRLAAAGAGEAVVLFHYGPYST